MTFPRPRRRSPGALTFPGALAPPAAAGITIRIDYDPEKAPSSATVTLFRAGEWMAELSMALEHLERRNDLQAIVDMLTKRGVRVLVEG